jgi:hypothetical protein
MGGGEQPPDFFQLAGTNVESRLWRPALAVDKRSYLSPGGRCQVPEFIWIFTLSAIGKIDMYEDGSLTAPRPFK